MSLQLVKVGTVAAIAAFLFSTSALANKNKEEHFKKMDTNSDGRITSSEHEASSMEKFNKADANRDSMLSKGELVGFMVDEKEKSGKKAEKKSSKKMDKFDSNKDGQLTRDEYQSGSRDFFSKMDSNTDGALTKDEMEKSKGKME